jgi:hypothetical protein
MHYQTSRLSFGTRVVMLVRGKKAESQARGSTHAAIGGHSVDRTSPDLCRACGEFTRAARDSANDSVWPTVCARPRGKLSEAPKVCVGRVSLQIVINAHLDVGKLSSLHGLTHGSHRLESCWIPLVTDTSDSPGSMYGCGNFLLVSLL